MTPPRSAEITRPLRLGRLAIIAGLTTTAVLILMLSLGVGRSTLGFARPMTPGRIEILASHPGGSSAFAFRKQIAMTRDGAGVVYVMETEEGDDVLATQGLDSESPDIGEVGDTIVDRRSDKTKEIEARAARSFSNALEVRYAAGHIVYARGDGSLWAAPFDENTNRPSAAPVQIGSNVAMASNGMAVCRIEERQGGVSARWTGLAGVVTQKAGCTISPTRIVFTAAHVFHRMENGSSVDVTNEEGRDVWIVDVHTGKLERATFERDAHDAAWTPDGHSITWTSFRLGALGIYRSQPGSHAKPDSILTSPLLAYSGEWLKGGSGIVTTATNLSAGSRFDIAFLGNEGRGPVVPIVADRAETRFPVVAANGRWLAYTSNQSGHDDVYVRAWNRPGNAMRLTAVGSTEPVWSPNGAELYFRSSDTQDLIDVSFAETADRIVVLQRRALFPIGDMLPGFTHANFDVSPDGNAFVMVRQSPADAIHVIKNLPEILRAVRGSTRK